MSDYTIVGWKDVTTVLQLVRPFVVFKREQVERALQLLKQLRSRQTPHGFLAVSHEVDAFATLNYSKHKQIDAKQVRRLLESKGVLVPVTTEAEMPRSRAPVTDSMTNLAP